MPPTPPTIETIIRYTTTNGQTTSPNKLGVFVDADGNLCELKSNTYDSNGGKWVFNGKITQITGAAFYGMTRLVCVHLPDTIQHAKNSVFQDCTNLELVDVGSGMVEFGYNTFTNCPKLKYLICGAATPPTLMSSTLANTTSPDLTVYVPDASLADYQANAKWSAVTLAPMSELRDCGKCPHDEPCPVVTIIRYATSDGNPVSLTAPERFVDASGTPVPIISNTVNEEGHGELVLGGIVDCINGATFTNSRLVCIHLPEEITSLGNSVFQDCPVLEYIELGSNVTVLGFNVIKNTPLARYLVCKGTTPPMISNSTLQPTLTDFKVYVPDESVDAYMGNRYWRQYFITPMSKLPDCGKCPHDPPCPTPPEPEPLPVPTQREVMYRSTTGQILSPRSVSGFLDASGNAVTLLGNAYASTSTYGELDFAATIEEIGYSAYIGVEELEEIRLPDTIKRITSAAFRYCSNLKKIHFGSGLQIIGGRSLDSCINLKEIVIEAPIVVTLDQLALYNTPADCVIKVRSNLVEQYKVANNWSSHADYIVSL